MPSRIVRQRDLEFQLFEVLDVESLRKRARFSQHSRETMLAAIDTAVSIAEEKFAPHNQKADAHEPTFDGDRIRLIPEVKEALDAYIAAGFDGTYSIRGSKIFISGGDHDLAENVHLVLAKIPSAPPGVKGISLFIVPKYRVRADGSLAFGHVVVAWMWLRQAFAAARALENAASADADFHRGKLAACRYFFRWELPRIGPQLALLDSLDSTCLEAQPDWL